MSESKFKSFTIEILDFLLGMPEGIISAFDRKQFYRLLSGYESERILSVSNICRLFHNLKKEGYISVKVGRSNQESIQFTNKAKLSVIERLADKAQWDGKYRLVSFDIPETLRRNRNCFRRALKRMGFKQIQKSLWVCDKNVGELVNLAAEEYKVSKYVAYFVLDKSDIDDSIEKLFA